MINERKGINCAIFRTAESALKDVKDKLNRAKREEKVRFAERLAEETEVLLSCPEYDQNNLYCSSCRFIAKVHKRTADLIIKVGRLGLRKI